MEDRAKKIARQKRWRAKKKATDPEWRERERIKTNARIKAWREKKKDDPEYIEKQRANARRNWAKHREKYLAKLRGMPAKRTEEGYENHVKRASEWNRKRREDSEYRKRESRATAERLRLARIKDPEGTRAKDRAAWDRRRPARPIRRAIKAFKRGDIGLDGLIELSRRQVDLLNARVRGLRGDNGICGEPSNDGVCASQDGDGGGGRIEEPGVDIAPEREEIG